MVSVIVPVYKVEKYIENSIRSLANQEYKDFEVILVDNNTPDNSIGIATDILRTARVVCSVIKEDKQGVAAARNAGVAAAKGEWIIYFDPDDIIMPNFIGQLISDAKDNNVQVAFVNLQRVTKETMFGNYAKATKSRVIPQDKAIKLFFMRKVNFALPAMIVNKSVYGRNIEHDEDVPFGSDAHHLWQILASVSAVSYNETRLYNYLIRGGSLTTMRKPEDIFKSHLGYEKLGEYYRACGFDKCVSESIASRNDFALIRMSARYGSFNDYQTVREMLMTKEYCENMKRYPNVAVKILSYINKIIPRLFFAINHISNR